MASIAWVGVDAEALVDVGVRGVNIDFSCSCARRTGTGLACLNADVSNWTVHVWMDELGVVLVHDFFMYQGRIFCLLGEESLEQEQLNAQKGGEKDGGDKGDRGTRVGRGGGKEQPVDEDMARREQGEELEIERLGVPNTDLPHIVMLVGMAARKDIVGGQGRRQV